MRRLYTLILVTVALAAAQSHAFELKMPDFARNEWMPKYVAVYAGAGKVWVPMATGIVQYNPEDLPRTMILDININEQMSTVRIDMTYDSGQRLIEVTACEDDGYGNLTPVYREVLNYDDVVVDFLTLSETYQYNGATWELQARASVDITRDEQGRVIEVVSGAGTEDDFTLPIDPSQTQMAKLNVVYGEDGLPTTVAQSMGVWVEELSQWMWTEVASYTDCTWEMCDGQILTFADVTNATNHLLSATLTDVADGEVAAVSVVWDNATDWTMTMTPISSVEGDDTSVTTVSYLATPNGGSQLTEIDRTLVAPDTWSVSEKVVVEKINDYRIVTLAQVTEAEGDETGAINPATRKTVEALDCSVSNNRSGYPYELIYKKWNEETQAMERLAKLVFDDFGRSAIDVVSVDETDASESFFDLQGHRVVNPSTGIFLRKAGSVVSKILKR